MHRDKGLLRKTIMIILCLLLAMGTTLSVEADFSLTQGEKAYIAKGTVIKAVSLGKAAPIQYTDARGDRIDA